MAAARLEAELAVKIETSVAFPDTPCTAAALAARATPHKQMNDDLFAAERQRVEAVKSQLDAYEDTEYRIARNAIFPLAHSGVDRGTEFSNRAGHKLLQTMDAVGMWDAVLGRDTSNADAAGSERQGRRSLTFVDICGGPGAFSQAIMQAAPPKVSTQGFGLTLMDKHVGATHGWYPALTAKKNYTVTFGIDGTGNIYDPANVEAFCSLIGGKPVQLAVADGGFEVPPAQQNFQEAFTAQIVYAQWYVAARVLAKGGCFVLKLFDTFTPFSRSLLQLSCWLYDAVYVVKPEHSRAVNSERYLACLGFRPPPPAWMAYFERVHAQGFTPATAPVALVPLELVQNDEALARSVSELVGRIAANQCEALGMVLEALRQQKAAADAKAAAEASAAAAASEATAGAAPAPVDGEDEAAVAAA